MNAQQIKNLGTLINLGILKAIEMGLAYDERTIIIAARIATEAALEFLAKKAALAA